MQRCGQKILGFNRMRKSIPNTMSKDGKLATRKDCSQLIEPTLRGKFVTNPTIAKRWSSATRADDYAALYEIMFSCMNRVDTKE
jgi:hypothetical protein